jgi:2-methylcitrate dehydratase PrpD
VTATARLLDFARAEHRLPPSARDAAERLLGDTLAVGAAGATLSREAGVLPTAALWGKGNDARLLGSDGRLPATSAAFVNGFRIHCLEWDAVHERAVVHALSVVTAALGAAIDRRGGCDPETALAALAVGVDVASGLGLAADGAMRFFRPATAGIMGAALAVARIEGVDRFADVLGLAYSQAAGTMQAHVEGSIALPLQIANAARAAVAAVDMAAAGLTGPHDVLEGTVRLFHAVRERQSGALHRPDRHALADRGHQRQALPVGPREPWRAGRHRRLGPVRSEVEDITAYLPPLVRRLVDRPMSADMTPAYARLCLPFLAALMLRDAAIDPRLFTPATFADPALAALAARVTIHPDDNPDPNALVPQRVVVGFADSHADLDLPDTLGSPRAPMSADQTAAKQALARALAGDVDDPRIFDNPLAYFTEPQ